MCPQPCRLCVALRHRPDILPPLPGRPAFPIRKAPVRWDVEGVGVQLRCGSRPACGGGCRSGLGRRDNKRVCRGEVRDPYPPPVWLVVVETPDPHVNEVVQGTLSQGEERLELPHTHVGSPVWAERPRKAPVAANALKMHWEGVYHVWSGRSVVDVVCPSQFLHVEGVPRVWWSGGSGGHDFPVQGGKGAGRGIVPWRVVVRFCVHVCRVGPGPRGRPAVMRGRARGGPGRPRPPALRHVYIDGGRRVAGVIGFLHRSPGGRSGACCVRVAGRRLLGHGWWCRSHVDFRGPWLVALGPPCRVRRCVWWRVPAFWQLLWSCCEVSVTRGVH